MDVDGLDSRDLRRLTRREYEEMARIGLFEDEKLELLRGWIVKMSPIGEPHAEIVDRLAALFFRALDDRFRIRIQGPFAASDDSEPEPDLAVYPAANYSKAHPSRALLVIEVADSSLLKDRGIKCDLYAEIGVPEYWIVNVEAGAIEIHRKPKRGKFTERRVAERGDTVSPAKLPEVVVKIAAILP